MAFNVMGHLGYEIFPLWLHKTWLGHWFNTSTHHNMHHLVFANAITDCTLPFGMPNY